jgi:hypothetical protein
MTTCAAVTDAGERCRIRSGLVDGFCLWHSPDPARKAEAIAARGRGGWMSRKRARKVVARAPSVRVAQVGELPTSHPPKDANDLVLWASWCAYQTAIGNLDPATSREVNRSLASLKAGIQVRDIVTLQKEHDRKLKQLQREMQRGPVDDES